MFNIIMKSTASASNKLPLFELFITARHLGTCKYCIVMYCIIVYLHSRSQYSERLNKQQKTR